MAGAFNNLFNKINTTYKPKNNNTQKTNVTQAANKAFTAVADAFENIANKAPGSTGTTTLRGSTKSNQNALQQTGNVQTDTSWKGDYLNVDLSKDYNKLMQDAANAGNFSQAANYEALRNAKINYLNANYGSNLLTTNNYIKDYGYGNNQGGKVYVAGQTMKDLQNGRAGTYNINGTIYNKTDDGKISTLSGVQNDGTTNWTLRGDGLNSATGEFTFSNVDDAKNAYVNQMMGLGMVPAGATYDDLAKQGLVDDGYLNAIMGGTTNDYNQAVMATVKEQKKNKEKAAAAATAGNTSGEAESLEAEARKLAEQGIAISDLTNGGSFEDNSKWMQYISGVQGHTFRWGGK